MQGKIMRIRPRRGDAFKLQRFRARESVILSPTVNLSDRLIGSDGHIRSHYEPILYHIASLSPSLRHNSVLAEDPNSNHERAEDRR